MREKETNQRLSVIRIAAGVGFDHDAQALGGDGRGRYDHKREHQSGETEEDRPAIPGR
ncbi:MAG: hypothetical protein AAB676_02710 [Verrucomicrobiota bacterium]